MSWSTPSSGTVTSVGLALPVSVFSVSGSPVTTTGTLTGAFTTQTANTVFAGPSSGVPAVPTFRTLTPADVNAWGLTGNSGLTAWNGVIGNFLGTTDATDVVIGTGATAATREKLRITNTGGNLQITTSGAQLSFLGTSTGVTTFQAGAQGATNINYILPIAAPTVNGQVLSATTAGTMSWSTPSSGTVTSVGLALPVSVFSVSGSPVTTTGTLTGAFTTQTANTVFAGPSSGVPAVPTFRTLTPSDVNAWGLTGNSGLTAWNGATGNFLGTTDATDVVIGTGATAATREKLRITNTGNLQIATSAAQLSFKGTSTGVTTFQAGAQGATNLNYTLPIAAPTLNGQVLSTTTAGILSWSTSGTGTVTGSGTATRVAFWGPGPGVTQNLQDDSSFYWDNTNKRLSLGSGIIPNTSLDVSKDFATREYNYTTAIPASINDANFDGLNNQTALIRLASAAASFSITGISGGANGKRLMVYNATGQAMTISNQSASSLAANRIITGSGLSTAVPSGGSINFIYSAQDNRWVAFGSSNSNNNWLYTGNSGLTDNISNLFGTLDNTNVRFISGSGGANTRMVLDVSGNLLLSRNSGSTSFTTGAGRFAMGDSLTLARLNSVPTITNNVFNLIDANAALRVWRFASNAGGSDPALDLIGGTNDNQGNIANHWWTISSTGTPGSSTSGTNSTGEHLAMRRRSGATDSEYVSIFTGGNVGVGGNGSGVVPTATERLTILQTDTITSSAPNVVAIEHNSSNTPLANFGASEIFRGKSSTTTNRDMAKTSAIWTTPTDASRTAAMTFSTANSGAAPAERVRIAGNGNVGVGLTNPQVIMDLNGGFAAHPTNDTLSNGVNNNIPVGNYSFIRIVGPTAPFTITGMVAGVDGQHVRLCNITGQDMTIADSSALSSLGNRIETNVNADILIKGPVPILDMTYDAATAQWLLGTLNANQIIGSIGSIQYATKSANTVRTNTAVVANDPDLFIPMSANQTWELNGELDFTNPANNIDCKIAFTIPTGSTMKIMFTGIQDAGGNAIQGNGQLQASGVSRTVAINAAVSTLITIRGIISTSSSSGDVTLKWAQGTASAANSTTLNSGSYLKIIRVK